MDTLRRFLIVPLAGAAMFAIPGCGNDEATARDEASEQIATAGRSFEVLALDPSVPFGAGEQSRLYTTVTTGVGRLNGSTLPEQQAAGKAMSAEAMIGLSRLGHDQLLRQQQQQAALIHAATQQLALIDELNATIGGVEGADFSDALSGVGATERETRARRAELQEEVNELRSEIGDLSARLENELAQSSNLREQAAVRRESAREAPLERRIDVLEEARRLGREADSHQVEAALLEAELAALRPDLANAEAWLAEADDQLASLAAARQAIQADQTRLEAEARTRRTDLSRLIEQLNTQVTEINRLRSESDALFVEVAENASKAVDLAQAAQRGLGGANEVRDAATARLTVARNWLSQVHWDRVRSLNRNQYLMTQLVEHSDLLGRGNQDQATLETLNQTISELRTVAVETAREALEGYEAIADDENDPVLAGLQERVTVLSGEGPALVTRPTTAPTTGGSGAATPAAPSESPRVLLEQLKALGQSGDFVAMLDLIHTENAQEQQIVQSLRTMVTAMVDLDQAARQAFGKGMDEIMKDPAVQRQLEQMTSGLGGGAMDLSALGMGFDSFAPVSADVNLDDVIIRTNNDGTYAFVDSGELEGVEMVYRGGQWKLSLASLDLGGGGAVDVPIEVMNLIAQPMSRVFSTVAQNTRDDMYSAPVMMVNDLITQFSLAFVEVAPQIMQMMEESLGEEGMQRMIEEQMGGGGGNRPAGGGRGRGG